MKRVSVMVVEDSPVARELIVSTLASDPRLAVISAVDSAEKALRLIPRISPDVISMDVRLPGMNGIDATRRIMEECPTPIVVVAADLRHETINRSMEALGAGALAVVEKPTVESADTYRAMARSLCSQFVNMSQVKVVRQRFNGLPLRRGDGQSLLTPSLPAEGRIEVVSIVASTGGPAAVARLLQGLSPGFPAPVLVVQHMGAEFLEGFAAWLDSTCRHEVTLARNFERPLPGRVYVAPGGRHLAYRGGTVSLTPAPGGRGHLPSGDVMLGSLASAGPRAVGILLTGMGDDGANGLLQMRSAGAHTIAQDKETSTVYGMPAAAMALNAAQQQLPLGSIANRINDIVQRANLREVS
jgi:two-component system chemotaxis response regulator CheB